MTRDELIVNIEQMGTFELKDPSDPQMCSAAKKDFLEVLQTLDVPTHEPHETQINSLNTLLMIAEQKIDYLEGFVVRLAREDV